MSRKADIAIGLHGGCGTLSSHLLSAAEWAESRDHLAQALRAGWQILRAGGSALDAAPWPALKCGLSSITTTAACTASSADPLSRRICQPARSA